MSFQEIRKKLPFQLSFRTESGSTPYTDYYNSYDVAIGGLPFLLKIDGENPLIRGTAQFKKQQLDISTEPGEQTLTGWWLRSQSSWHWGKGLKYGDPELDQTATFRFWDSEGVNCWEEGQLSLLNIVEQRNAHAGSKKIVTADRSNGENWVYETNGVRLDAFTAVDTNTVYTDTNPILDITTDGLIVYIATLQHVVQINPDWTTAVKWTYTATRSVTIGWTKQRIILCVDNKIYQPDPASSTLPANPLYTHPNTNWTWSDVDEGPQAIYVSGYAGNESSITRLTLDTSGAVPTLQNATVVADFPTGEIVYVMHPYLSTYLGIGTGKGVRIAVMGEGGSLSYGPLIETPQPVYALRAKDSYILAGYSLGFSDGTSGLLRIELSTPLPSGRFPYAKDLQTTASGIVRSLAIWRAPNGQLLSVLSIDGGGQYMERSFLRESGWLQTANQRYNTVWPKLFKRFNVRGDFKGPLIVSSIDDKGVETNLVNVSQETDQTQDFSINYPDGPQEFIALKFTLNRVAGDIFNGTILRSYQLKAIPGGPRPRQFVLPLLCFDYERDGDEVQHGYPGFSVSRLEALEELDSSGDVILFEELRQGRSYLCTIEAIEFRQVQPRGKNNSRWGGILTVSLRTLSA